MKETLKKNLLLFPWDTTDFLSLYFLFLWYSAQNHMNRNLIPLLFTCGCGKLLMSDVLF